MGLEWVGHWQILSWWGGKRRWEKLGICQLCQHVLQDILKKIWNNYYQESAHLLSFRLLKKNRNCFVSPTGKGIGKVSFKNKPPKNCREKSLTWLALISSLLPVKLQDCQFYLWPSFCAQLAYTASSSRMPVCNV